MWCVRRQFIVASVVMVVPLSAVFARADALKVDPVHSAVIFKIQHMNAGMSYGRFNQFEGEVVYDEKHPEKFSVEVHVQAETIDTNSTKRDQHLKSPDFFNAKQFKKIDFKSKSVRAAGENTYDVTGDLTLHGVTKPLTVRLIRTGEATGKDGARRVGFETAFKVKRSEFGMSYMLQALGDEVQLIVALEAVTQ